MCRQENIIAPRANEELINKDYSIPCRFIQIKLASMLLLSLQAPGTAIHLAEPQGRRKWLITGYCDQPWDSGCTCEASQPRWKSSPGRGEPKGPSTSGWLVESKDGQPTSLKHQHTLQNLSGPEKDAMLKTKTSALYKQILPLKRDLFPALLHQHTARCGCLPCVAMVTTRARGPGAWQHLWAAVWAHTPEGRGAHCFLFIANFIY